MPGTVEEPTFEVARRMGDIEVREYAPYVVAEVMIEGTAELANTLAFPILAGYIFGKNKGSRPFTKTASVTPAVVPVQFAMTAPVTQTAAPGGYLVQFMLPKGVTLQSAPEPDDARVRLREVAAHKVAAIRYTGFWSESNFARHLAALTAALKAVELRWSGEPVFSRYNAPWTPWFMRRNEIWLSLS
jgi:hypothetical protein